MSQPPCIQLSPHSLVSAAYYRANTEMASSYASIITGQPQRRLISSFSVFEAQIGYSRAVVSGEWIFVSGTTGYPSRSDPYSW